MSIYSSTFGVGDPEWDEDTPGVVLVRCDGGCNHYPTPETCRKGSIDGAHIPGYCVRGHEDSDAEPFGGWYRLSFYAPGADAQMLLDEDAVKALHADLTRWLAAEKVSPDA